MEGGEERGEEEEEGRGEGEEGDIDDRPPPYSPGVSGSGGRKVPLQSDIKRITVKVILLSCF